MSSPESPRHHATHHRVTTALACVLLALVALAPVTLAGDRPRTPDYVSGDYLFILTSESDYSAGNCTLMDMHAPWPHDDNYGAMFEDAVARSYEGLIYVINRIGGDNIQVLDPDDDFRTILQFSTGAGSNPQDICFVDAHRAFITRYEETELWEVDPTTGECTDTIDLSLFADNDGIPEMHGMAIHEDHLYVALQRIDRYWWVPTPPSYLAVIDLADNSLIDMDPEMPGTQAIPLTATCPNSWLITDPLTGDLLVGEVGEYFVPDGGIERIDPVTGGSRGMIVTEAELGGDLNVWTTADGIRGFAVTIDETFTTHVVAIDLLTAEPLGTMVSANQYAYSHLLVDPPRRQLFVCDRTYENPGVRIFDTHDFHELTSGPIPVGLYPFWLLDMHGVDSGANDPPLAADRLRLQVRPQPAVSDPSFLFQLATPGEVCLELIDISGRRVAGTWQRRLAAGEHQVSWTQLVHARPLSGGTYFIHLRSEEGEAAHKFHLVR